MTAEPITWVTSHPDGRWIAVGDYSGRILIWAPGEERIVAQQKLSSRVLRVEWTADGRHLVAIAQDAGDALHLFAPDGSSVLPPIATGHENVRALAVHPSKPWVATVGDDSHVRVWDLEKRTAIYEKKTLHPGSACALSDSLVAVGSEIGEFDVWDFLEQKAKAGGELFEGAYVGAMAFSPDGKSLVIGGSKGKLLRFGTTGKWTCTHEWKETPPRPIATNDIRYRDDNTWVAAHSDDRASLFKRPADAFPEDLGSAFWLDRKKKWDREFIVSSACFVPGTNVIFTAHFSGRLRVFAKRAGDIYLRLGDVVFDAETGGPKAFGAVREEFRNAKPPDAPVAPAKKTNAIVLGDREHRARTVEEMMFAASLHPCTKCGGRDARLALEGGSDTNTLRGVCHFCGTPKELSIWVDGEPAKRRVWPNELGEHEPSALIEPRAFFAELERLEEIGIDDRNRARALTCVLELLKFVLVRDGERGDELREKRDRFRAELKEDARPPGPPPATVASIVHALVVADKPPETVGDLEHALGVSLAIDPEPLRLGAFGGFALGFTGLVTRLAFAYGWDLHHQEPAKTVDELRKKPLTRFGVTMTSGGNELQRALGDRFGEPRVTPTHRIFGETWMVATRGPEITVSWYAKLPDGALPPIDPVVREKALGDLARAIASASEIGGIEQAVKALPSGCGARLGKAYGTSVSIEIAPPMAAPDLARIFGWKEVFAETRDMHGSTFYLFLQAENAVAHPRIGRWATRVFLKGWPKGGELPHGPPIGGRHRVGREDLVNYVVFEA